MLSTIRDSSWTIQFVLATVSSLGIKGTVLTPNSSTPGGDVCVFYLTSFDY